MATPTLARRMPLLKRLQLAAAIVITPDTCSSNCYDHLRIEASLRAYLDPAVERLLKSQTEPWLATPQVPCGTDCLGTTPASRRPGAQCFMSSPGAAFSPSWFHSLALYPHADQHYRDQLNRPRKSPIGGFIMALATVAKQRNGQQTTSRIPTPIAHGPGAKISVKAMSPQLGLAA